MLPYKTIATDFINIFANIERTLVWTYTLIDLSHNRLLQGYSINGLENRLEINFVVIFYCL